MPPMTWLSLNIEINTDNQRTLRTNDIEVNQLSRGDTFSSTDSESEGLSMPLILTANVTYQSISDSKEN